MSHRLVPYLNALAVLVITALTVNRFAPTGISADLAINSVMSLQNITLFYWGQNRLANALPLMAAVIRNPAANFYAILYLSTAVHFVLIFVAAHLSNRLVAGRARSATMDLCVFLAVCAAQLIVQRHQEFIFIAGHIEYTLSALPLLLAFMLAISGRVPWRYFAPLTFICIFIATGVNFSVVLAALALTCGHVLVERKLNRRILTLLILSVLSAVVWFRLSEITGGSTYSIFRVHNIPFAVWNITVDFLRTFDMWRYLAILAVFGAAIIAAGHLAGSRVIPDKRRLVFVVCLLFLFSVFWLLFFSANKWVEKNNYSYRYFTYVIYVLFFYLSTAASILIYRTGRGVAVGLGAGAAAVLAVFLWSPVVPLRDYKLFQEVRAHSEEHYPLYAGNYWRAWPAVLRSLIAGHESFGLTHRGEANRANVRIFVRELLAKDGSARMLCIDATPEDCLKQTGYILDGVSFGAIRKVSATSFEIDLQASP